MKIGDLFLDLHVDTAVFKKDMADVGKMALGALGIVGVAIAGVGVKAAMEWETAFAGVRKTVDATEEELSTLSDTLRDMAGELGMPAVELAALAEAAGALGIKTPDIAEFVRTAALLGVTTDVASDQAATALGKINAVMPLTRDEYSRFAATLVDLGNKGASTESQIIDMAQNMAGAGAAIGMSHQELLSWAAAAANAGMEAEAGSSAFQRLGLGVQKMVVDAGPKLEQIAELTGMTGEAFAELWGEDSSEALRRIIEGLAEMDGTTRQATLAALGFTDIRLTRYLLSLSANQENLNDALLVGAGAWDENAAHTKEFAKRAETFEFQLGQLRAELGDIAITIGEALLPHLKNFVGFVKGIASGIGDWMSANKDLVGTLSPLLTLLSGILAVNFGGRFMGMLLSQVGLGGLGTALATKVFPPAVAASGTAGQAAGQAFSTKFKLFAIAGIALFLGDAIINAIAEAKTRIQNDPNSITPTDLFQGRAPAWAQAKVQVAQEMQALGQAALNAFNAEWDKGIAAGLSPEAALEPARQAGLAVGGAYGSGAQQGFNASGGIGEVPYGPAPPEWYEQGRQRGAALGAGLSLGWAGSSHEINESFSSQIAPQLLAAARALGAGIPGEIGRGMQQAANQVFDGINVLRDILKNGTSPEGRAMDFINNGKEYIRLLRRGMESEKEGARETAIQVAVGAINAIEDAGLGGKKGRRGLKQIGIYYDELLAAGLTAAEARVVLAAGKVSDATITNLENKRGAEQAGKDTVGAYNSAIAGGKGSIGESSGVGKMGVGGRGAAGAAGQVRSSVGIVLSNTAGFHGYGAATAEEYRKGLASKAGSVQSTANYLASLVRTALRATSPPDNPLIRDIGKWGRNTIAEYASGLLEGVADVKHAVGLVASPLEGLATQFQPAFTRPGFTLPVVGPSLDTQTAASGRNSYTFNVETHGLPMRATTPLEVVDQLRRAVRTGGIAPPRGDGWRVPND